MCIYLHYYFNLNSWSRTQWYGISQWKFRILTKLGPDGLYNTQSRHITKWPPKGTPGGHQGALYFLPYENWRVKTSHLWVSKKIVVGWPEGGPKGLPKGCQKNWIRLFFDPPGPLKLFFHSFSAWTHGVCEHSDFFLKLSISQNIFKFHGKDAKSLGWSQIWWKTELTNFGHFIH